MTKVLHMGCGLKKRPGAIGADLNLDMDADVICDFNSAALPFADSQFDEIVCEHVLEHLDNLIAVMEEIYRVGKAGGNVFIQVPYFSSVYYYHDPTHKHPFTLHTFDYFIEGTPVRHFKYTQAEFRLKKAEFPPPDDGGWFNRLIYRLINRYQQQYEKHLAFILPRHTLNYSLEIVK